MKYVNLFILVLILWLRLSMPCTAQLRWETRELEFSPPIDQKEVIADFRFQNVGQSEIKITSVNTSCGCTTAALEKNAIALGENGEMKTTFSGRERVGLQQKTIVVESIDPESPHTTITVKLHMPNVCD